jgi:hypothetical protein
VIYTEVLVRHAHLQRRTGRCFQDVLCVYWTVIVVELVDIAMGLHVLHVHQGNHVNHALLEHLTGMVKNVLRVQQLRNAQVERCVYTEHASVANQMVSGMYLEYLEQNNNVVVNMQLKPKFSARTHAQRLPQLKLFRITRME